MKYADRTTLPAEVLADAKDIGDKLSRLRKARRILQSEAAVRAGLSRSTAVLLESGDPGRTLSQVLRYLNALSPGATMLDLLNQTDPALKALQQKEATKRVRTLSEAELREVDF